VQILKKQPHTVFLKKSFGSFLFVRALFEIIVEHLARHHINFMASGAGNGSA
jgi:hypothetical protein